MVQHVAPHSYVVCGLWCEYVSMVPYVVCGMCYVLKCGKWYASAGAINPKRTPELRANEHERVQRPSSIIQDIRSKSKRSTITYEHCLSHGLSPNDMIRFYLIECALLQTQTSSSIVYAIRIPGSGEQILAGQGSPAGD